MREQGLSYAGLFTTLDELRRAQQSVPVRDEFRVLCIRLAELLCQAPDYADQAAGIQHKTDELGLLLSRQERLPEEQRLRLHLLQQAHAREFASFPRTCKWVWLTPSGLEFRMLPSPGDEGVRVIIGNFLSMDRDGGMVGG